MCLCDCVLHVILCGEKSKLEKDSHNLISLNLETDFAAIYSHINMAEAFSDVLANQPVVIDNGSGKFIKLFVIALG